MNRISFYIPAVVVVFAACTVAEDPITGRNAETAVDGGSNGSGNGAGGGGSGAAGGGSDSAGGGGGGGGGGTAGGSTGPSYPILLYGTELVLSLAADDTNAYWLDDDTTHQIVRLDSCLLTGCPGGSPTTLTTLGSGVGSSLTACSGNLFMATSNGIETCPVTGCTSPAVFASPPSGPVALACDGSDIYWTDANDGLWSCPLSGCTSPTALTRDTATPSSNELVVDGATLLWANQSGQLVSCPTTGCPAPSVVASPNVFITSLAASGGQVVWTASEQAGSALYSCSEASCQNSPVPIVQGLGSSDYPVSVATDGHNVFWLSATINSTLVTCPVQGCNADPSLLWGQSFVADEYYPVVLTPHHLVWSPASQAIWSLALSFPYGQ